MDRIPQEVHEKKFFFHVHKLSLLVSIYFNYEFRGLTTLDMEISVTLSQQKS